LTPLGNDAANSTADEPIADGIFDALDDAFDDEDEGCNCGKPPARQPLLTDDLVIAARERAREP
jgi:hypothetical protein